MASREDERNQLTAVTGASISSAESELRLILQPPITYHPTSDDNKNMKIDPSRQTIGGIEGEFEFAPLDSADEDDSLDSDVTDGDSDVLMEERHYNQDQVQSNNDEENEVYHSDLSHSDRKYGANDAANSEMRDPSHVDGLSANVAQLNPIEALHRQVLPYAPWRMNFRAEQDHESVTSSSPSFQSRPSLHPSFQLNQSSETSSPIKRVSSTINNNRSTSSSDLSSSGARSLMFHSIGVSGSNEDRMTSHGSLKDMIVPMTSSSSSQSLSPSNPRASRCSTPTSLSTAIRAHQQQQNEIHHQQQRERMMTQSTPPSNELVRVFE